MKRMLVLSFAFAAIFLSCKKDPSSGNNTPDVGGPKLSATPVTGSVAGMITDENNNPVENAQVTISGNNYVTNSNGIFKTAGITLDKYISTVKVTMPGYFTAYRSFSASTSLNYVSIKLIPKSSAGTFNAAGGGTVSLTNGCSISFQANAIKIKSNGASYQGTVNVFVSYIDPTAEDISLTMPGSNMAEDADKFYVTRSMGAMVVELESVAGEALQLEAAKPATMKTLIPVSLQNSAPGTIDTWSLDDRGIWIKEGQASKSGNFYTLEVSHFSYWGSNIPATPVFLSMTFKNQDNRPLTYANIVIHGELIPNGLAYYNGMGWTDETGTLTGVVPANITLQYEARVWGSGCNTNPMAGNLGPYTTNASENFVLNIDPAESVTITGTAFDCVGNPVADGIAEIYIGFSANLIMGGVFREVAVVNGSFECYFPLCQGLSLSAFNVVVSDNNTNLQSATIPLTFANMVNAGSINTCGVSTNEFINYTLDGTNYLVSSTSASAGFTGYTPNWGGNPVTEISGGDNSTGSYLSLRIRGNTIGTFTVPPIDSIRVNNFWSLNLAGAIASITNFPPAVGQFYEGNFDVPFTDAGVNHTLTGTYRIKKDY